eukprot:11186683-Lingulodinium_polyedra.AAC.1
MAAYWDAELLADKELGEMRKSMKTGKVFSKGQSKAKALPAKLQVSHLKQFLPPSKGCFPYFDPTTSRVRVFYTSISGFRQSHGMATTKADEKERVKELLAWAWKRYCSEHGIECPYAGVFD